MRYNKPKLRLGDVVTFTMCGRRKTGTLLMKHEKEFLAIGDWRVKGRDGRHYAVWEHNLEKLRPAMREILARQ